MDWILPGCKKRTLSREKSSLGKLSEQRNFREGKKRRNQKEVETNNTNPKYWKKTLKKTRYGAYLVSVDNIAKILKNDSYLLGTVKLNAFTGRIEAVKGCPCNPNGYPEWDDNCSAMLAYYLSKEYGLNRCTGEMNLALASVASENSYHPVRDYLDALPRWDGKERVPFLLSDYLGAKDEDYTRETAKRWLAAAVGRIYHPGMKFDSMLLLSGSQGIGKSTFFSKLAVKRAWFSDSVSNMDKKSAIEDIQGKWILEISELSGMKKSKVESVKAFLSRENDHYRPPYGRYVKMLTLLAKVRQAEEVDEIQARDIEKEIHRVYKVPLISHPIHPVVGKKQGEYF